MFWHEESQSFIVTRWEDCESILNDPDTFVALGGENRSPASERALGSPNVLSVDGPCTAISDRPSTTLSGRRLSRLTSRRSSDPSCGRRSRTFASLDDTSVDLMESFFEPISVRVLGQVMGLDGVDDDTLRRWFAGIISGLLNSDLSEDGFAESDQVSAELSAVIRSIIDRVSDEPDGSAISYMVHSGREPGNPPHSRGSPADAPRLHCRRDAGTRSRGGLPVMLGLLSNPDQLARVASDSSLVPRAVEEGLRWIAPLRHGRATGGPSRRGQRHSPAGGREDPGDARGCKPRSGEVREPWPLLDRP